MTGEPPNTPRAEAVIFDMDGTLIHTAFDFDAIRREIGLPTETRTPILEAIEAMTPEQRTRAENILHRHESRAAQDSVLHDQAAYVIATLRAHAIPVALLTRNTRASADTFLKTHGLTFDVTCSRDECAYKPAPDPVLYLCHKLGVAPSATWSVGDYLFDLQSANAAGAVSVLVAHELAHDEPLPDYAHLARHVIRKLDELLILLGLNGSP